MKPKGILGFLAGAVVVLVAFGPVSSTARYSSVLGQAIGADPYPPPANYGQIARAIDKIECQWDPPPGAHRILFVDKFDFILANLPGDTPGVIVNGLQENTQYNWHVHALYVDPEHEGDPPGDGPTTGTLGPAGGGGSIGGGLIVSGHSNYDPKYTLVHDPTEADFQVFLVNDHHMGVTVHPPPNPFAGQTGVEITRDMNVIVSAMSQVYAIEDPTHFDFDEEHCYHIQFQNGDGILTQISPHKCLRTPPIDVDADCACVYCPPADPIGKAGGLDMAEGTDGGDPTCGGAHDHNEGGGGGADGGGNMPAPGDGNLLHATTDIASSAFGGWGHTRMMAHNCKFDVDYFRMHGSRQKVQQMSQLAFGATAVHPMNGALWVGRFRQESDSVFSGELFLQSKLERVPPAVPPGPDEYRLTDTRGGMTYYDLGGKFLRYKDPAGNTRTATWSTVLGEPRLTQLFISGPDGGVVTSETWVYDYYTDGPITTPPNGLLKKVTLKRQTGTQPEVTVRQAEYTYYVAATAGPNGNTWDLELVEIKDGSNQVLESKYYRYSPSSRLTMVVPGRAYERMKFVKNKPTIQDVRGLAHAAVREFATLYVEYEGFGYDRVTYRENKEDDGTGGKNRKGASSFAYFENLIYWSEVKELGDIDKMNAWRTKMVETTDGAVLTTYLNKSCMPILKVVYDTVTDKTRRWFHLYDQSGRLTMMAEPSAVTNHDEIGIWLLKREVDGVHFQYLKDNDGLIHTYQYHLSTNIPAGAVAGYKSGESVRKGEYGADVPKIDWKYTQRLVNGVSIFPIASETVYKEWPAGPGGILTTSYTYDWFPGTFGKSQKITTHPIVPTTQNGSGTAQSLDERCDGYERVIWLKDEDGFLHHTQYDPRSGATKKRIVDVNTTDPNKAGDYANLPMGWSTPAGGGLHLMALTESDDLGRTTRLQDSRGNVTYKVYKDSEFEVRAYPGWNVTANPPGPTGPTHVRRQNRKLNYDDHVTMSAVPTLDPPTGTIPTGMEQITSLETLSRVHLDASYRVEHADAYFSYTGITYDANPSTSVLGNQSNNYNRTGHAYDARSRLIRKLDSSSTTVETSYDGLSQVLSKWMGRTGGPLVKVVENQYDFGAAGDGTLTSVTMFASKSQSYVTEHRYDWQNRRIQTRGPDKLAIRKTLDNVGHVVIIESYADSNSNFQLDSGELRLRLDTSYDNQGRDYRTISYPVSSAGSTGDPLITDYWFNHRGQRIKARTPNGLFAKFAYDGSRRKAKEFTGFDPSESTYIEARDASGDTVVEQAATIYDAAGNPVTVTTFKRHDNDSTSTGELTSANAYINVTVNWYDRANRTTHAADFGRDNGPTRYVWEQTGLLIDTNGDGIPDEAGGPAREPNTSDDYLVSKTAYNSAGFPHRTYDNLGRLTERWFDGVGRDIRIIEGYDDGIVDGTDWDKDRTVEKSYAGALLKEITVYNPKGAGVAPEAQRTRYLHMDPVNGGLITNVISADSTDLDESGTDQEKAEYDWLGSKTRFTDQRGVVHRYVYDSAGRQSSDDLLTVPSGVDGTVLRIGYTYDDQNRREKITSYADVGGTSVLDEVKFTHNIWGGVAKVEQEHAGSVVAGATPAVEYVYSDGATGGVAKYVRLSQVSLPGGPRIIHVNYPGAGTIGDMLNRVESLAEDPDGTARYVEYTYLGVKSLLKIGYPGVAGGLSLNYGTHASYSGIDRFGRIIDQKWQNEAGTAVAARFLHGYNRVGLRMTRDVLTSGAPDNRDEYYEYDRLDRLTKFNRGSLSGGMIQDTAAAFNQAWGLDALGNWREFKWDADGGANNWTITSRNHNEANETTSISGAGSVSPAHDAAGNMIKIPKPGVAGTQLHVKYDGWGRTTQVLSDIGGTPGETIATYRYNGLGWRISKSYPGGGSNNYYYDEEWQLVEVRKTPQGGPQRLYAQYIWDARNMDALTARLRNADESEDGSLEERLYYAQDANFNVAALVDATGAVVERYEYDPYGTPLILSGTWETRLASQYVNDILLAGCIRDSETGLYQVRNRYYHSDLGRFLQRDPLLENRPLEHYLYAGNNPISKMDPYGLDQHHHIFPLYRDNDEFGHNMGKGWQSVLGEEFDPHDYTVKLKEGVHNSIKSDVDAKGREVLKRLQKLKRLGVSQKRLRAIAIREMMGLHEKLLSKHGIDIATSLVRHPAHGRALVDPAVKLFTFAVEGGLSTKSLPWLKRVGKAAIASLIKSGAIKWGGRVIWVVTLGIALVDPVGAFAQTMGVSREAIEGLFEGDVTVSVQLGRGGTQVEEAFLKDGTFIFLNQELNLRKIDDSGKVEWWKNIEVEDIRITGENKIRIYHSGGEGMELDTVGALTDPQRQLPAGKERK